MIISEDPLPIKRLRAAALKAGLETTLKQKVQTFLKTTKISLGALNVFASSIMMAGILLYVTVPPLDSVEARGSDATPAVLEDEPQGDLALVTSDDDRAEEVNADEENSEEEISLDEEQKEDEIAEDIVLPTDEEIRIAHLEGLLAGHPMEVMASALATEDPQVAAFIVGIGKIESNWGKRSPSKNGVDCYNYWGYKTSGSRGQSLGFACFGSPEEAVETIARRLNTFVLDQGRDTAEKLLVWKCGRSCATHSRDGVARWVSVVQTYSDRALAVNSENFTTAQRLSRR